MKNKGEVIKGIFASCAMLIIILDTRTALSGAITGIQLCLNTIVPSLFPFLFLSGMINNFLLGQKLGVLRPLGWLCKIPKGGESLLILGFLAGYPVGAQTIMQAYRDGQLSSAVAKRMLGFCNNAGPAFLFGMLSVIFTNQVITWALWFIHILSALCVGFLLPGESTQSCQMQKTQQITAHNALRNALKTIAVICGWVIVFRMVISFCDKWFLRLFPVEIQVFISGFLELSNGCVMLQRIPEESIRFLLASIMLAFGGICVGMQTCSVTSELGSGYYFPGKVLQALFSLFFATIMCPFLFKNLQFPYPTPIIMIVVAVIGIVLCVLHRKKLWHLREECCIIPVSVRRKEQSYAVSKENHTLL